MAELQKSPWSEWETVRFIGRGSFGTVYEIQRQIFDEVEKAALKVITIPQNTSDIEEMYGEGYDLDSITATFNSHLKSIVAEYSLMRKIDGSANIVNCKDIRYIQHDDGIGWDIYIRMELLTPLMKALPVDVTEETVIKIGRDICNALVLCNKHEIVHRDIKPQNIFVSPNGDYKLGDFGIAKTIEKTMGGTKIGTYKYMAPEVYNNQPYGISADIYSFGLVLYWLLNERRMPFMPMPPAKLTAGIDEEARQRRFSGEPLPLPAHGSDELKKIVLRACAYNPNERYNSAAEMLEDLNKLDIVAKIIPPIVLTHDDVMEQDATVQMFPCQDSPIQTLPPKDVPVQDSNVQIENEQVENTQVENTQVENTQDDDKTIGMFFGNLNLQQNENSNVGDNKVKKQNVEPQNVTEQNIDIQNSERQIAVHHEQKQIKDISKKRKVKVGLCALAMCLCWFSILAFPSTHGFLYNLLFSQSDYSSTWYIALTHGGVLTIIISVILILATIIMLFVNKKRIDKLNKTRMLRVSAVIITTLQGARFSLFDSYSSLRDLFFPLSYCGIFIFALWIAAFGKKRIKRIGEVFIAYGCSFAGIACFVIPTMGHVSLYGLIFHLMMIYLGITLLYREKTFNLNTWANYWIFVGTFFTITWILSFIFPSLDFLNFMNLFHPYDIRLFFLHDLFAANSHRIFTYVTYTACMLLGYLIIPLLVALISGKMKFKRNNKNLSSNKNKTL